MEATRRPSRERECDRKRGREKENVQLDGGLRGRENEKKEYFRGRPFVPHVSKLMAGASTETLEEKTII